MRPDHRERGGALLVGPQQPRTRSRVPRHDEGRAVVDVLRTQVERLSVVEVDDHPEVAGVTRPLLRRTVERPDGGVHQMAAGEDAAGQLGVRTLGPAHLRRVHVHTLRREVGRGVVVVSIEDPRRPIEGDAIDLARRGRVVVDPEPERPARRRIHGRRRRIVRRTIRVVAREEELVRLVDENRSHHRDHPARHTESAGDRTDDPARTAAGRRRDDRTGEQDERDQEERTQGLGGLVPRSRILHRHLALFVEEQEIVGSAL